MNYRERADAANTVCSEIIGTGRKAIAIQADVSVSADVRRMIAEVEANLGGIDILVNNAAIAHPRKLEEITETEWDEVLTVNLKSVFLVTQAVVRGMRQRKWGTHHQPVFGRRTDGRGSGSALCGLQGGDHRTDALLRLVIRSRGNHRDPIAPALIETDMVTSNPNANPNLIPMGHFGSVDDISSVAVMLAMNEYMTGQTISVNGGWMS